MRPIMARSFEMLHTKIIAISGAIALVLASFNTLAQSASASAIPAPSPPTLSSLELTCTDFKHNQNGSWSPLHPIQVGGVRILAGVSFREGTVFSGIDLAAILKKECK
jgi:hypothetical protein